MKLAGIAIREILETSRDAWGFRTKGYGRRGGGPLALSQIYRMFDEPFYAGVMRRGGATYPGTHAPMITWTEFEQAQEMIHGSGPRERSKGLRFTYRGLIVCGACGATITAQYNTNRHGTTYTYYHCCRKTKAYGYCPEPSLQEKEIEAQLGRFFESFTLPQDVAEFFLEQLDRAGEEDSRARDRARERLGQLIERKEHELQRLRDLVVREVITEADYLADHEEVERELRNLRVEYERMGTEGGLLKPFQRSINIASRAISMFNSGDYDRKRDLVRETISNLSMRSKTLLIEAKEPYLSLSKSGEFPNLRTGRDSDPRSPP